MYSGVLLFCSKEKRTHVGPSPLLKQAGAGGCGVKPNVARLRIAGRDNERGRDWPISPIPRNPQDNRPIHLTNFTGAAPRSHVPGDVRCSVELLMGLTRRGSWSSN